MELTVLKPTSLWIALGKTFFGKEYNTLPITNLAGRRYIVNPGILTVRYWNSSWTGKALMDLVGYSSKGTKLKKLRETYIDDDKLFELKGVLKEKRKDPFLSIGMNFNMKVEGKGGCLSSFHIIKDEKDWIVTVHAKIAEIPKKFAADMVIFSELLRYLDLEEVELRMFYSCMYWSIVGLRAYVSVLGKKNMDYHGLPIEEPRNYQVGTQEGIAKCKKQLVKYYGKKAVLTGIVKFINERGEWV